jgi:hypothetical protein
MIADYNAARQEIVGIDFNYRNNDQKIKFYIVLLFLGVGLQQTYSQNYNQKTSGVSVLEKNERGKWGKWSDLHN